MVRPFADRLIHAVRKKGPLCVGIDPHPHLMGGLFGPEGPGAIAIWGQAIVELAASRTAVVKPQAAFFERWGAAGMAALEQICRAARDAGLLVILDAKRGDIGSTAEGYAEAYLGPKAAIPCDALTINPYMGLDTLDPFISAASETGRGVFILTRTSNPGAMDFQGQIVDDRPLFELVAERLAEQSGRLAGQDTDWSGVGLVAGATAPSEARRLRKLAPRNLFLVPGYGAQGAGADEALSGFASTPSGLEGGVVNASRSVTFPAAARDAETAADWEAAVAAAMDEAQNDLKSAVLS